MVKLDDAVVARYHKDGKRFEILIDPNLGMDLKNGKEVNFNDLLVSDDIFKDSSKGDMQSPETVKEAFGTNDVAVVVKKIIKDGEVQLTTEQRKKILERKHNEIVTFISQNALNPQTNSPHPPTRIETAMQEAKIHVDLQRSVQEQVPLILKELKKLLPISMEKLKVAIKIPTAYAGKATAIAHKYDVKQEQWQSDGSLVVVFEIPAGLKNELFNQFNSLTHGDAETKILEGV